MDPEKERSTVDAVTGDGASKESTPGVMLLGIACVIGAVAANVFGFRYSRWAIGKDLHRAWERYSANTARQVRTSGPSSGSAAASGPANGSESASQNARRSTSGLYEAFRQAAEDTRGGRRTRQNSRDSDNDYNKQSSDSARGSNRNRATPEEEASHPGSDSKTKYESFHYEFYGNFDDFMRSMPRGARMNSARGFPGMGIDPRILEELLRAAQSPEFQSRSQQSNRTGGFNGSFDFWDEVFGSATAGRAGSSGQQRAGFGAGDSYRASTGFNDFGNFGARQRAFATLGLKDGASTADIKQAYRKEVLRWHPDKYNGNDKDGAARKFREVTSAYETLTKETS